MPTTTQIEYRWLEGDELALLEPTLLSLHAMSVNRETTRAIGAFDNGELIGFFCLQLIPHLEPLFVAPDYRAEPVAINLVNKMVEFLKESDARGAMLVAEHPGIERLAEHFGMARIIYPLYSKVNMGDGI